MHHEGFWSQPQYVDCHAWVLELTESSWVSDSRIISGSESLSQVSKQIQEKCAFCAVYATIYLSQDVDPDLLSNSSPHEGLRIQARVQASSATFCTGLGSILGKAYLHLKLKTVSALLELGFQNIYHL